MASNNITVPLLTTICVGCKCKLKTGSTPKELFITMPGINVWEEVLEKHAANHSEQTTVLAENHQDLKPNKVNYNTRKPICYDKDLSLCINCFNGYVTGKQYLSPEILGISIVRAPYSEKEKSLKIEGPTKFVNIINDEENSEENYFITGMSNVNSNITAKSFSSKRECDDELKPNRMRANVNSECKGVENVANSSTINYLSIGSGSLGAVEMTDDDC